MRPCFYSTPRYRAQPEYRPSLAPAFLFLFRRHLLSHKGFRQLFAVDIKRSSVCFSYLCGVLIPKIEFFLTLRNLFAHHMLLDLLLLTPIFHRINRADLLLFFFQFFKNGVLFDKKRRNVQFFTCNQVFDLKSVS